MTNESSSSAKVHSTSATVLNTTSRCDLLRQQLVGQPASVRPESPIDDAGAACGAMRPGFAG